MIAKEIKTCFICGFTNAIVRGKCIEVKQGVYAHERCAQAVMEQRNLAHSEKLIAKFKRQRRNKSASR